MKMAFTKPLLIICLCQWIFTWKTFDFIHNNTSQLKICL